MHGSNAMGTYWDWQRELLTHASNADIKWALRLAGYARGSTTVYVSAERVAADYGCSKATVQTGRKRVVKAGWLTPTGEWKLGQQVLALSIPNDLPWVSLTHLGSSPRPTRVEEIEDVSTSTRVVQPEPLKINTNMPVANTSLTTTTPRDSLLESPSTTPPTPNPASGSSPTSNFLTPPGETHLDQPSLDDPWNEDEDYTPGTSNLCDTCYMILTPGHECPVYEPEPELISPEHERKPSCYCNCMSCNLRYHDRCDDGCPLSDAA